MSSVPPPINVNTSHGQPSSSPLPSPSFSLAPQRSASLRMGPAASPSAGGTPSAAPSASPADRERGEKEFRGYSMRGGLRGAALAAARMNETEAGEPRYERSSEYRERDRDRDRDRDRGDREYRSERREYSDKPYRGGGSERGGRGGSGSYRGGRSDERGSTRAEIEREKKLSSQQMYANSLPVVGLLVPPPSPPLPPSFNTSNPVSNPFSALDGDGDDTAGELTGIDEDLPDFPLTHGWQFYFDKKSAAGKGKTAAVPPKPALQGGPADSVSTYESQLQTLGRFETIQEFWQIQNHLLPPSELEQNSTLHLFKDGIKPVWEDPANRGGGKWIYRIAAKDKNLLDHFWQNTVLSAIGCTMDEAGDELCGVVLSRRRMGDRIAVWNRSREDTPALIALGHRFRAALMEGLPDEHNPSVTLSYEDNEETIRVGYCAFGSNVRFNL